MTAYLCSAACGVLMAASLLLWHARPQPVVVVQAAAAETGAILVTTDREQVAVALLSAIGNNHPTAAMISEVVVWSVAEDGGSDAMSRNNPWNTTMCGYNMLGSINGDGACGVGHYATMNDGIAANAATLMQGNFSEVRGALLANDPEGFKRALWASPWASSHYGYGANWPAYQAEETQPPVFLPTGNKHPVTDVVDILSRFDTVSCDYWKFQVNCQHWGTDFLAPEGSPVYAPFDLTVIAVGEYGPGPTMGQYVQGTFPDGYVFYAGHLQGRPAFAVGEMLSAGTVIGYTNRLAHSHVQLAGPGNTGACAQDGSCVDFERYYEEH